MIKKFEEYINEGVQYADIPEENQGGDCYKVGYDYFMKNCHNNKNLRLCHGLVTGQGPIKGIKYNHCWCEDENTGNVIDMTMPEFFQNVSKQVYYYMGKINADDVYQYDLEQVTEKVKEFNTYGPWEEKLLKNKY